MAVIRTAGGYGADLWQSYTMVCCIGPLKDDVILMLWYYVYALAVTCNCSILIVRTPEHSEVHTYLVLSHQHLQHTALLPEPRLHLQPPG